MTLPSTLASGCGVLRAARPGRCFEMTYLRTTLVFVALVAAGDAVRAADATAEVHSSHGSPRAAAAARQQGRTPARPAAGAAAPSESTLNAIRAQIAKRQFKEALAALEPLPATAAVSRLRIDAALGAADFAAALESLDALNSVDRKQVNPLLVTIARAVIEDAGSRDTPMNLESCKVLLSHGASPSCAKALGEQARNTTGPLPDRLHAAAALAVHGDTDALALFRSLAKQASGRAVRSVVTAASDLPPGVAVELIAQGLASPEADIRYTAAAVLGDLPSPESRAALSRFLANDSLSPSPAKAAARISLAVLGEPAALKEAANALPDLQGDDLLRVGVALMKRDDPRGVEAVTRALKSERELTRIAAAAALSGHRPEAAKPVLMAALTNTNPLIRAAALEEFRSSPLLSALQARGLLLDADPVVRLRAGDAIVERLEPRRQPAAASSPARKASSSATPPGA